MTASKTIISPILQQPLSITHSKRKFFSERFQRNTLLLDLFCLNLSLLFGVLVVNKSATLLNSHLNTWMLFLAASNLIWLITATYNDVYKWYEIIRPYRKVQKLLYINSLFFSVTSSLYYYIFFPILNINFLLPTLVVFMLLNICAHLLFRSYYQQKMPILKYIIVGGEKENIEYIKKVYKNTCKGKSYCLGSFSISPKHSNKWSQDQAILKKFILQNSIDKLLYINSSLQKKEVNQLIKTCDNRYIDFEMIPREFYMIDGGARIINEERIPTLAPHIEPLQRTRNKFFKRAFDIVFSLAVILLIFPWLFPIIALLIKLESRGPVFFFQQRTGYWNRSFNFIKFRSMRANKNSDTKQALRNDDRVTTIGTFLRKTSLDELPQFFNVLRGDMSVVGPRPHMLKHTEEYAALIDSYMVRHKVKPGITGWAQINGYRGPTETLDKMEKRVEFDVHYMRNWTIIMDVRCIIFTVVNMIIGEKNAV